MHTVAGCLLAIGLTAFSAAVQSIIVFFNDYKSLTLNFNYNCYIIDGNSFIIAVINLMFNSY